MCFPVVFYCLIHWQNNYDNVISRHDSVFGFGLAKGISLRILFSKNVICIGQVQELHKLLHGAWFSQKEFCLIIWSTLQIAELKIILQLL